MAAGSSSSSSSNSRVRLAPRQLKAKLEAFKEMGDANREFMEKPENKNLHTHLQYMLQLLSPHDDPLLIGSDIVTDRMLAMERLSGGRVTSVNNAFSAVRCAFRLLFGRSLQPGIEAELTTVKVGNDKLRIDLHSPLPDAAVSEYKTELSLRGTLAREAQGTIRSLESVQLQLVYALTALLEQLDGLKRWPAPDFIPPRSLDQVNRWSQLVLALLFRVLCNERPSNITLYHLGCFKLAAPDHSSTHLASLALAGLQQDAVHHIDDMLEAFRGAGAVLLISAPKCKQSERKRGRGGGQQQHVDWLSVRKHLLQPQLALWDPARLVVLCLMASWFSRGSIAARLLLSRRFRSAKAAPKRQQQPDFQDDNTRTRPLLLTCRPAQSGGRARRCPLNFQQAPALLACPWTWSC
ncbi:hypothetical protein OEZ85_003905 [Tetradesmus obliquus]|uniref:Uncharacterized protein n=2 Tax=Tetradesmus obliquus TaxID=3088 RepID=A0ABY8UD25_TETOB|nr:hypothetical protein OEZ85_003905 [Tetradesmus obliquus]